MDCIYGNLMAFLVRTCNAHNYPSHSNKQATIIIEHMLLEYDFAQFD